MISTQNQWNEDTSPVVAMLVKKISEWNISRNNTFVNDLQLDIYAAYESLAIKLCLKNIK